MSAGSGTDAAAEHRTERRVDLYVRDGIPVALVDTVEATIDRVARLQKTDAVEGFRVKQWPPTADGDAVLGNDGPCRRDRVGAFREWADERGYSLEPGFEVRTVTGAMLGRPADYERVSVPLVALAYYEDGDLAGVAPYTDGSRTYTVNDCLSALETEGRFPAAETAPDRGTTAAAEASGQ